MRDLDDRKVHPELPRDEKGFIGEVEGQRREIRPNAVQRLAVISRHHIATNSDSDVTAKMPYLIRSFIDLVEAA